MKYNENNYILLYRAIMENNETIIKKIFSDLLPYMKELKKLFGLYSLFDKEPKKSSIRYMDNCIKFLHNEYFNEHPFLSTDVLGCLKNNKKNDCDHYFDRLGILLERDNALRNIPIKDKTDSCYLRLMKQIVEMYIKNPFAGGSIDIPRVHDLCRNLDYLKTEYPRIQLNDCAIMLIAYCYQHNFIEYDYLFDYLENTEYYEEKFKLNALTKLRKVTHYKYFNDVTIDHSMLYELIDGVFNDNRHGIYY